MGRILRGIAVAVMALGVALPSLQTAEAHTVTDFYPAKWRNANGGDTTPDWHFMSSVPFTIRDNIVRGFNQWNAQYQAFSFVGPLAGDYGDWDDPCARPPFNGNGVRFMPGDGPGGTYWAWAKVCPHLLTGGWQYTNFLISLDSTELWWQTTTDNPPDNQGIVDTWAVVAHESGHATGFGTPYGQGHFYDWDTSTCSPAGRSDVHTMCARTTTGSARERTLEYHDYEVFRAAY